jgi:hypothetical protein
MSETLSRPRRRWLFALAAAALAGCGDELTLPPATQLITQQQITLFALSGTSVLTPSAYSMLNLAEVRVDLTTNFDFAFDIRDTVGGPQAFLIPRGNLGFGADGGLQLSTVPFDSLLLAPTEGYERIQPVPIDSGSVILAASRIQSCDFAVASPRYAKLLVLSLDMTTRSAVIRVIIDPNCGYRGLGTGIPTE